MEKLTLILENEQGEKISHESTIPDELYRALIGVIFGKSFIDTLSKVVTEPKKEGGK